VSIEQFIAGALAAATYELMCELHPEPTAPFDARIWDLSAIYGRLAVASGASPFAEDL
jgi:hypothetical protein